LSLLVSIVIPTYNQAHFLAEALESVRAQTYPHWEAIVVNNYSQDNTIEVVERFDDPRIHLVNFRNNEVIAASRNVGIRQAKGEYIAFLDSDDLWEPVKIERCVKRMGQGFDLVCHGIMERWEDGRAQNTIQGTERRARYKSLLYDGNCFATSATVARKKILIQVNGFDENPAYITAEDYDLWLRIAKIFERVSFIHEQLGTNRIHGSNASSSDLRYFHAECAVIASHFDQEKKLNRLKSLKMRKRYAMAYYSIGRKFQEMGKINEAFSYFFQSIKKYPLFKDLYISCALAIIGWFYSPERRRQ